MENTRKKLLYTIGIDEVGRGPLAGPVAVCATRTKLSKKQISKLLSGIRDSKKATKKEREEWYAKALVWKREGKINWKVSFESPTYIDKKGIVTAVHSCIGKSIEGVEGEFIDSYLLDGGLKLPKEYKHQTTIIRGDSKEPLIALAATIAKVVRDKKMVTLAKKFKGYDFENNKGYGTKKHLEGIKKLGITTIHRRSFLKKFV